MVQEGAVVLIVAAAVVFVLRRFGLLRPRREGVTFVPLSSLRTPTDRRNKGPNTCH